MKDDASLIVTGILIQAENERRNRVNQNEQDYKNKTLNEEKNALLRKKNALDKEKQSLQNEKNEIQAEKNSLEYENSNLEKENSSLEFEVEALRSNNVALYNKAVELQEEVDEYKRLLCKPMQEIAEKNVNFKETYEKQMELMAEWMVSQKAFKELAIQFGFEKGLNLEEVIQQGSDKRLDVLDSKHEENHNTNSNNSSVIRPRIEKLKEKISKTVKK